MVLGHYADRVGHAVVAEHLVVSGQQDGAGAEHEAEVNDSIVSVVLDGLADFVPALLEDFGVAEDTIDDSEGGGDSVCDVVEDGA